MESVEQYRTVSSPMKKNPKRKRVIGLRVSSDSTQGGRKYMEDMICIVFDREQDADYACFAVFDGHGGKEAAVYARDHLWKNIKEQDGFFSREPGKVMYAIEEAFRVTQEGMWKERQPPTVDFGVAHTYRYHVIIGVRRQGTIMLYQKIADEVKTGHSKMKLPNFLVKKKASWPKTLSGYPSTAGTTCSMVIICGTDMYTAHVGDSRIVLGKSKPGGSSNLHIQPNQRIVAEMLTIDHKPSDLEEIERIESAGGRVQDKAGVQRVVWSRPRLDHTGPITRNTELTDIPFLAVARSLGDLWSYNFKNGQYIVSPEPDISHRVINPHSERFLILGSDGLWNMVTSEASVQIVEKYDKTRTQQGEMSTETVSHQLVNRAMDLWNYHLLRADNISVISVFFEYPEVIDDEGDQIDLDAVKEWQNIGLKIEGEDNKEVDENGDNFTRPALIRRHACTKLTSMENYNRLYCMSNKERRQYGSIPAPQYKRRYTDGLELPKPKKQKPENGMGKRNVGERTCTGDKIYKVIHTKKCGIRVEYAYDPDAEVKPPKAETPPNNNPRKTIMTKSGPIEVEYAYDVEEMKRNFEDTPTKIKAKRTFMTKKGPIEVLYECEPPTPGNGRNARSAPPKKSSSRRSPRRRLSLDDNVVMGSRLTRSAAKRSKVMNMHMTRARRASMKGKFAQMYNEMPGAQKAVKMR